MEESASVRRWRLAERLERKARNPNLSPELAERAKRDARALKQSAQRHEVKKLTAVLEKHGFHRGGPGDR